MPCHCACRHVENWRRSTIPACRSPRPKLFSICLSERRIAASDPRRRPSHTRSSRRADALAFRNAVELVTCAPRLATLVPSRPGSPASPVTAMPSPRDRSSGVPSSLPVASGAAFPQPGGALASGYIGRPVCASARFGGAVRWTRPPGASSRRSGLSRQRRRIASPTTVQ